MKIRNKYIIAIILAVLCGIIQTAFLVKMINIALVFPYVGTPSYNEKYGSFTPEDTYSYDGRLIAHQEVEKGLGINSLERRIIVNIKDSETGELIGSFSPARAWDFWGICWENDSYNIWIQSGDTGCHRWKYENGEWKQDLSHPERPDYIISKYD